jgi:hypothetical protein
MLPTIEHDDRLGDILPHTILILGVDLLPDVTFANILVL